MQYHGFFNDNPKRTMAALLIEAITAYEARFGRPPREILVSQQDAGIAFDGVVTVRNDLIDKGCVGLVI